MNILRLALGALLMGALSLLLACEESERKEPRTEPVTSFGQAVHSSKELSNTFDQKADDLEAQADLLEEE